jgi:histidinol-phosphate aminotransferase
MLFRACAGPGDRVVYPTPTYSLYETLAAIQGATAAPVPYPEDFEVPVDRLGEQGQTLTIVCNPNAPSGTPARLSALEALATRLRGLLVIDEAYVDFARETALPLVHRHRNIVVLRTFSKSFSLCGMRIGLAFGHPDVLAQLAKVKDSYNVNHLAIVAATAALDDLAWMQANADRIRAARADLGAALRDRGFDVLPSEANFVLARRRGSDLGPLQRSLRDAGVLVRHFATPELRDALRITVGTPEDHEALFAALART